MGSFGNYLEEALLEHIVGKVTYSLPTAFIALSTADPTDTGGSIAEPSGNGYTRVTTNGATWNNATANGGAIDNASDITFPEATGTWGTITHFAIFDAGTGGNFMAHGSISPSKQIQNGDTAKFAAGDLDITLD